MKRIPITIFLIFLLICVQCKKEKVSQSFSKNQDRASVEAILKILDDHRITSKDKVQVWVDDLVHMAPNTPIITNKTALIEHITKEKQLGFALMKHEITEMHSFDKIVLMHGKVTGTFYPMDQSTSHKFSTKNLFVFRRMNDNSLKIWKVIFNMTS
ncbi:hypothetical protein ACWGOQ_0020290 [Aquimarina sp. M1]